MTNKLSPSRYKNGIVGLWVEKQFLQNLDATAFTLVSSGANENPNGSPILICLNLQSLHLP